MGYQYSVDTAAVIGTIFGIATTCGIGVVQLNYGLHVLLGLPENIWMQFALIAIAVGISIISVTSGVNKVFGFCLKSIFMYRLVFYCLFCSWAIPSFYSMR